MISIPFSEPYYSGTSTLSSTLIPSKYAHALGGHVYLIDLDPPPYVPRFRHSAIPLLKPQSDTSNIPGEHSLNTEGGIRVSQESWHRGAGQQFVDKDESDHNRFRTSKGILVWNKWEMGLLQSTISKRASANSNLQLVTAGARAYLIDGQSTLFATDLTAATPFSATVTGTPASSALSIASDGTNVLIAYGTNGIYLTDTSSSAAASYITGTVSLVAYAKDRIMAAGGASIYNITTAYPGPAALPAALFTHRNSAFTWVGFAEGQRHIYAAGFLGDKSTIYRTQVQPEGTALSIPVVAGELPDGEVIRAIQGYLSYIVLGTDLGVRFCAVDADGNLVIGSLIPTASPVKAFEPQDKYVWYGLTNYDSTSTGLGRLNLQEFTSPLTPAYASDIMATGQGEVASIITFQSRRAFTVSGSGVFVEDMSNKVLTGTLDTGLFTFSTPDPKTLEFVDVRYKSLAGTHTVFLAKGDGVFSSIGSNSSGSDTQFSAGPSRANEFELRHSLARSASSPDTGPIISRHTLKGFIALDAGYFIYAPFLITERDKCLDGSERARDPKLERAYLIQLHSDQATIPYQEGDTTTLVTVDNFDWFPTHLNKSKRAYNGTMLVKLRVAGSV